MFSHQPREGHELDALGPNPPVVFVARPVTQSPQPVRGDRHALAGSVPLPGDQGITLVTGRAVGEHGEHGGAGLGGKQRRQLIHRCHAAPYPVIELHVVLQGHHQAALALRSKDRVNRLGNIFPVRIGIKAYWQHGLHRRTRIRSGRMHGTAKHEQGCAPVPDQFFEESQFIIGEKRFCDVTQNHQVVLKRVFP